MARPHPTAKPTVNLASNPAPAGPRVSRIRRDPPPAKVEKIEVDPDERDQWAVIVGILTFALAIAVIVIALGRYSDWSPRAYSIEVTAEE